MSNKPFQIAKAKAEEMLGPGSYALEIERESYKEHDVWSITLSLPAATLARLARSAVLYKRSLIDAETGELMAMKLREVA